MKIIDQEGYMSEIHKRQEARTQKYSTEKFNDFMGSNWISTPALTVVDNENLKKYLIDRRKRLSEKYENSVLVIPAGVLKTRNNDCDYTFRCHSCFAYYSGLANISDPGSVLVFYPNDEAREHKVVLYITPSHNKGTVEAFTQSSTGEFWVGKRPSEDDFSNMACAEVRILDDFESDVKKAYEKYNSCFLLRNEDAKIDKFLDDLRGGNKETMQNDFDFYTCMSKMRVCKDPYEIAELKTACEKTKIGFDYVLKNLKNAMSVKKSERYIQAKFEDIAMQEGNGVGYETISAAGNNAATLHWVKATSHLNSGKLLLLDAGIELDSLYTADITRTVPADGKFTKEQKEIYNAVLKACMEAKKVALPGNKYGLMHETAMRVVTEELKKLGISYENSDECASVGNDNYFRRWMPHGTGHHLGLDVHDVACLTREELTELILEPGMVFTIEPGIYLSEDDELVPEKYRGIAVRIEDDILVTENGNEYLSDMFPRTADDVEEWVQSFLK